MTVRTIIGQYRQPNLGTHSHQLEGCNADCRIGLDAAARIRRSSVVEARLRHLHGKAAATNVIERVVLTTAFAEPRGPWTAHNALAEGASRPSGGLRQDPRMDAAYAGPEVMAAGVSGQASRRHLRSRNGTGERLRGRGFSARKLDRERGDVEQSVEPLGDPTSLTSERE